MTLAIRALAALLLLPSTACMLSASDTLERPLTRTFEATGADRVRVRVAGGGITVATGEPGRVEATLTARVRTGSEAEADSWLSDYDIVLERQGDEIVVSTRRKPGRVWTQVFGDHGQVQFRAEVKVPADIAVDLDTSGGGITVEGQRTAAVKADTSGGGISVDGGSGDIDVDTSGGSIRIGRALGQLRADTSGGGITVDYVGPSARTVGLDTSGGSIRVGVDPRASLRITADTSGGGVSVEGLPFTQRVHERQRIAGTLNDGAGTLRAHTSGGSIRIGAAAEGR
jgi:hypothetical protein